MQNRAHGHYARTVSWVSAAKAHQAAKIRVHLQERCTPVLGVVEPAMRANLVSAVHGKHMLSGTLRTIPDRLNIARSLGQSASTGRQRLRLCAVCRNVHSRSACVCTTPIATAREAIRRTRSRSRCQRRRTPATPATPPDHTRRARPARCTTHKGIRVKASRKVSDMCR